MNVLRIALPRRRVYYGWWVVIASSIIGSLGSGLYYYGFTVFFLPLSADLNLDRTSTSLVFAVSHLEGGIYGAAVGWLIDRYGPRRLFRIGAPVAALGFFLFSRADSFLFFFLAYVGVLSLGFNAGVFHPATAAVNTWFVRRKGTALSVLSVAYGLGGAVIVPLLGLAVSSFGWRTAALLAGVVILVVVPTLATFVHRSPESIGLRPDGDPQPTSLRVAPSSPSAEYTVREAVRTFSLWALAGAVTIRFFVQGAVVVHLVPIMVDKGLTQTMAAGMVGLLALVSLPSRALAGWLADRMPKRYVLAGAVGLEIMGLIVLLLASDTWHLYLFVAVYSLGYGCGMIPWAMLGEYYGRRRFATLRGLMGLVYTWGSLGGPIFAGWIFDRTQSYHFAILTLVVTYTLAVVLYLLCRPPAWRGDAVSAGAAA